MSVFFHVGYPKCASTTLQRAYFQNHPQINYFGIRAGNTGKCEQYEKITKLHRLIARVGEGQFSVEQARGIATQLGIYSSKKALLSNERVLSTFFSYPNIKNKALRLKKVFPNCKIIVLIRNQLSIIKSQYRDWPFDPRNLHKGEKINVKEWYNICAKSDNVHFLDSLKYNGVLRMYEDIFGEENVFTDCFERLLHEEEKLVCRIFDYININNHVADYGKHFNKGNTYLENMIRSIGRKYSFFRFLRKSKAIKHAFKRSLKVASVMFNVDKEKVSMSKKMKKRIQMRYSESNTYLSKRISPDLVELGYPVR